jgi:hypothetical protein
MAIDPTLSTYADPIPALQLFAHRYRTGAIAPGGAQVRGKTVGDAVRAVGQAFSSLGLPDPRLTPTGALDLRLSRLLSSYNKQDPPQPSQNYTTVRLAACRSLCPTIEHTLSSCPS